MHDSVRNAVAARAVYRCEYCGIAESDDLFAFHVEHVIPLKHGGSSALDNLAFACQNCNLHKGSNLSGIDPASGAVVELFNPRQQPWSEHFSSDQSHIHGTSSAGRATVRVLSMNDADRVQLRSILSR